MAKKETKASKSVKVRALMELPRIGYSYSEGDEFELPKAKADELVKDGYVELCGK